MCCGKIGRLSIQDNPLSVTRICSSAYFRPQDGDTASRGRCTDTDRTDVSRSWESGRCYRLFPETLKRMVAKTSPHKHDFGIFAFAGWAEGKAWLFNGT